MSNWHVEAQTNAEIGRYRMIDRRPVLATTAVLAIFLFSAPIEAQEKAQKESKHQTRAENAKQLPAAIWEGSSDPATLDLVNGAGGRLDAPDPNGRFAFVDEDMKHTQPKFDVQDAQGINWRVKLGEEAKAEVAATRLVWAARYYVDEDYYLDQIKVDGLPKLHRGEKFASQDGVVRGARLERKPKEVKKLGDWNWFDNPFVGTRELNGLRVMMALLNNWDLAQDNNSVYAVDGQRRYVVSDLGASFGKTGDSFTRSKNRLDDYANSKFIDKAANDYVDFEMHSRPFFVTIVNAANYRNRTRMQDVAKHIPRADAKWLGQRLAQLSESQIRDCFQSAGYSPQEVDGYTKVVRERIAQLNAL